MNLLAELRAYCPFNEQEEKDRAVMIQLLESGMPLFERENPAHFTASAWVVSKDRRKVLLAYHNIYQSWAWMGGHADGDKDLRHVALKEVGEECGAHAGLVMPDLFSLEILTVDGHMKRGVYVPSHLHLNVTFLLEADEAEIIRRKADENSAVGWFDCTSFASQVTEPWMNERVYAKLEQKRKSLSIGR